MKSKHARDNRFNMIKNNYRMKCNDVLILDRQVQFNKKEESNKFHKLVINQKEFIRNKLRD